MNEDFREQVIYDEYIDSKLPTYLSGWEGKLITVLFTNSETYKFLKVGKSDVAGYIQTPALNLSGNSGNFELSFDMSISV